MPISSILVALGKIPDAELAALTVSRAMPGGGSACGAAVFFVP